MSKFIAVIHRWHVSSKGFQVHELESDNRKDAEREASWLCMQAEGRFRSAAYKLIELSDNEVLLSSPRKLTWKERFTGKLENT